MRLQKKRDLCYTLLSMKHETEKMRRRRMIHESIRTALATLLLLAVSLLTFAWFHHARPQKRVSAGLITATPTPALVAEALEQSALSTDFPFETPTASDAPVVTPEPTPVFVPWIEKFADCFTPDIVSDGMNYTSPDLSIHVQKVQYGKADTAV